MEAVENNTGSTEVVAGVSGTAAEAKTKSKAKSKPSKKGKRTARTTRRETANRTKARNVAKSRTVPAPAGKAVTQAKQYVAKEIDHENELIVAKLPRWQAKLVADLPRDLRADHQVSFYVRSIVNAAYKTAAAKNDTTVTTLMRRALEKFALEGFPFDAAAMPGAKAKAKAKTGSKPKPKPKIKAK